jgi:hypothetical protein
LSVMILIEDVVAIGKAELALVGLIVETNH